MKTKKSTTAFRKEAKLKMLCLHAKHLWLALELHEARSAQLRQALIQNSHEQDKVSASIARRHTRKKKE